MRANVCSLGMQDTSCMQDTRMFVGFRASMSSVKQQPVPSCSNLSRLFGIDMHEEQLVDGYCRVSDSQVKGAPTEEHRSLTTMDRWVLRSVNAVISTVSWVSASYATVDGYTERLLRTHFVINARD